MIFKEIHCSRTAYNNVVRMTLFSFFTHSSNDNKAHNQTMILKKSVISNFCSTDTGEKVRKWTRVFSTLRSVILVARTRRKKKEKKIACPLLDAFACEQVSSPRLYRLNSNFLLIWQEIRSFRKKSLSQTIFWHAFEITCNFSESIRLCRFRENRDHLGWGRDNNPIGAGWHILGS